MSTSSFFNLSTWNGENRLIWAVNSATGIKLEFAYDYMGRRILKVKIKICQSFHSFPHNVSLQGKVMTFS
jgi:hypothetical protein